jgi:dCMP deaminase
MSEGAQRPSWASIWLDVATTVARRATCPRLHVGAVLVNAHNEVISTGYNGAPRGVRHCVEVGCALADGHCWRAIHAEENAILQAARSGQTTIGATLYCTVMPCIRCARALHQAGVVRVVYKHGYANVGAGNFTLDELRAMGLVVEQWSAAPPSSKPTLNELLDRLCGYCRCERRRHGNLDYSDGCDVDGCECPVWKAPKEEVRGPWQPGPYVQEPSFD